MKPLSLLTVVGATMLLSGCLSTSLSNITGTDTGFVANSIDTQPRVEPKQKLLENLVNSCDLDKSSKLSAADSVMEQIVKITIDTNGKIKKNSNPDLQLAGDRLLKLTKKMYTSELTSEECKKSAESVAYFVYLSKVDLDSLKNNQKVLTTSM